MSKFKGRQPAGPTGDGELQVVSRGMLNELEVAQAMTSSLTYFPKIVHVVTLDFIHHMS